MYKEMLKESTCGTFCVNSKASYIPIRIFVLIPQNKNNKAYMNFKTITFKSKTIGGYRKRVIDTRK